MVALLCEVRRMLWDSYRRCTSAVVSRAGRKLWLYRGLRRTFAELLMATLVTNSCGSLLSS